MLIAAFGIYQFALAQLTSTDDNPNLVGNGMLMMACWYGGIMVVGLGAKIAGLLRWPMW
jgi:hypothetical protein